MTSQITLSKTQQDMLHANLSSEVRLFSCAKKLYLRTFNLDTIFGTKEGVVYKPDENYLVHFLVHLLSMAQFWCHTLHWQELQQMVV
jgi:hypothetical protein